MLRRIAHPGPGAPAVRVVVAPVRSVLQPQVAGLADLVPVELVPGQQAALEDMKGKKGYLFDAAYMAAQIYGHDQTLTELKTYAASGDDPALKEFAEGLIPAVGGHLEKAKTVNEKIGVGGN